MGQGAGASLGTAATGAASAGGGLAGAASAAMPWVSLGLGAANIGMSLVEASKQKELQRAADRAAENAAAEQKRLLSQNFFDALQVPTQAYDRALRENTAQQQQALSALQEGDPRLLLGGVGKIQAVTTQQNAADRDVMADKLYNLDVLQAQQSNATADQLAALEAQRLSSAQEMSASARAAALQQQQNALGAGGKLLTDLTGMIPEYSNVNNNTVTNGTGSAIFNNQLKYQQGNFLAPAPMAPVGFGQSAFTQFAPAFTVPQFNGYQSKY